MQNKSETGLEECNPKTENGKGPDSAPSLQSAIIPLAGTSIILTFDDPMIPSTNATGFSLSTNTIASTSTSGNIITLVLGSQVAITDSITISYTSGNVGNAQHMQLLNFTSFPVTNTMTRPTIVSAIVPVLGDICTLLFSHTTSPMKPATGATGFTFSTSAITSTAASGLTQILTLTTPVLAIDTPTLDYTPGNVTGGNLVPLLAFSGFVVTNNSIQV